jgi:4-amino-4-deoxy-L-arabinose transferase-like glycosyltransferase
VLTLPKSSLDRWLTAGVALLALAALSLALRPDGTVFMKPLSEDGYYSLAVARNIAAGHGITIDGLTRTNGFQPLLTFLQAGLFALARGDDLLALRLVLLLYWLLYLGTGAMLGWIAAETAEQPDQRLTRALSVALVYLGASYLFLHHFNGLETGLLLFLLASAWRLRQSGHAESFPGLALFGGLLGLAVLARIDAAFIVAVLCLAELWRQRQQGWSQALGRPFVIGAAAVLVSLPWWIYCYVGFGSIMPISGQATQSWGIDGFRLGWFVWGYGMGAFPWLFGGEAEGGELLNLLRLPLFAAGVWVLWRVYRRLPPATRDFALALALAMLLLGAWYWLSSFAYWFYSRYLAPASLPVAVGLGIALADFVQRRPRLLGIAEPVLVLPVVFLAALAWEGLGVYGNMMFWEQVQLVRSLVPETDTVAAGQSGTLNFFRDHVVNMDGKVNPEVFAYKGHLWDYLAMQKIHWFVDWPVYVQRILGDDPGAHGWKLAASRGNFQLYRYDGP